MTVSQNVSRFNSFHELDTHVSQWAQVFATNAYFYSSAASWYCDALNAKVISKLEYEQAKACYGARWHYTGD